jgi:hypothetical protein
MILQTRLVQEFSPSKVRETLVIKHQEPRIQREVAQLFSEVKSDAAAEGHQDINCALKG